MNKPNDTFVDRPSIVEIIGRYTDLRGQGRELLGLCPLHAGKTPSLKVNDEKGLFYCHACGEGGDCFSFVMKIEGLTFKETLSHLGYDNQPQQTSAEIKRQQLRRETSRILSAWALTIYQQIGVRLRELEQWMSLATDEILSGELEREHILLDTLERDLSNPNLILSLWQERQAIERLVGDDRAYSREELEKMHPPLTDAYRKRLTSYARGKA